MRKVHSLRQAAQKGNREMNAREIPAASKPRRLAALVVFLILSSSGPARAWGERAHRLVNAAAVENLPEPLRAYFRARKSYFVEHAIDPDILARQDPEERPHHYTEADAYKPDPFLDFKKLFVDERRGPSSLNLEHGDSVWQVERLTLRLEEAMRGRRLQEADRASLFAAHYACDLTQPLHTVVNYDGQLTGQSGIHARFETELVNALANEWVLKPSLPRIESDLRLRIFREMFDSYSYRNPLFAADRIAAQGRGYRDPRYFQEFTKLVGLLARRRLEAAISFVSSLWYTAWVRAGKPDLGSADAAGRPAGVVRSPAVKDRGVGTASDLPHRELLTFYELAIPREADSSRPKSRNGPAGRAYRPGPAKGFGAWRIPGGKETDPVDRVDGAAGSQPQRARRLSSWAAPVEFSRPIWLRPQHKNQLRGLS